MIIVVMGVSASGKSVVGRALAARLGWHFIDADDLHPPHNIEKMASGVPLTETDREPWLEKLRAAVAESDVRARDTVVACSALSERFRSRLRSAARDLRYVYLRCDETLIEQRITGRSGHFMPPELLRSQFAALEEPADAIVVDGSSEVDIIVDAIAATVEEAS